MGKYSVSKSLTVGQIATLSLWNSKFIHTKSKSLCDESLVSKGIMTVSNLFDNEGELKNWETISEEFSLNPVHFLKWYGVLKSIPSNWKKTLKGYNTEDNLPSEEESQFWPSVYLLPASVTLDIKIRMFQHEIIKNILYLNQRLYRMNLVESPLCSLCKREVESILECGQRQRQR